MLAIWSSRGSSRAGTGGRPPAQGRCERATSSRGAGFAEIRARWLKSAAGLGGPIRVAGAQGSREGVFEGLDADGRLLMRTAGALETIEAADIFLAPPADGAGGGPRPRAEILDESLDR